MATQTKSKGNKAKMNVDAIALQQLFRTKNARLLVHIL